MKLLVDNIRSASNIGSLFRTSDAFGVRHIFLCGISATPPNKEILKTALGATETVSWSHHENAEALAKELMEDPLNYIVSAEQHESSVLLNSFHPPADKEIILVLGNEVEGVSAEILALSHRIIEIPQFGMKKSLNVSVAAGISIWEIESKAGFKKRGSLPKK